MIKFEELIGRVNKLLEEGRGNGDVWDKINIKSLRNEFYSYLKIWLSSQRTLDEISMKEVKDYIDDFELNFSDLDTGVKENDADDIMFYTGQCEMIFEECKEFSTQEGRLSGKPLLSGKP